MSDRASGIGDMLKQEHRRRTMKTRTVLWSSIIVVACSTGLAKAQVPVGTAFTYQGQLKQGGLPVTDTADFQFSLWDALAGGNQIGAMIPVNGKSVVNGLFTVTLDFGPGAFASNARWLEIAVRISGPGGGDFNTLTPRQESMPAPYALALPGLWTQQNATSPNLIGGWEGNWVTSGVVGATVSGGGTPSSMGPAEPNRATDHYGTVSGGIGNQVGNDDSDPANALHAAVAGGRANRATGYAATVGGGHLNTAGGPSSTIGGGEQNQATAEHATIPGGERNVATSDAATVGGGYENTAAGVQSTVAGGRRNSAGGTFAAVGGGSGNAAAGQNATIPGGNNCAAEGDYSFAAGHQAKALHTGSFVWADSTVEEFSSSGVNQFLIRAGGGVGINMAPSSPLAVGGIIESASGGFKFPDATIQTTAGAPANSLWNLTGNAGTNPATDFLGTTDNQALLIKVNSQQALRVEPAEYWPYGFSPNMVGGYSENRVTAGAVGATIGGGGYAGTANRVTDCFSTVGGGAGNRAGNDNTSAVDTMDATVAGGRQNTASGFRSTVSGGGLNTASGAYSTIGGGLQNSVSGDYGAIPGGSDCVAQGSHSFAAGYRAKANHDGAFVWADQSVDLDVASSDADQFTARASGGVRFYSNWPLTAGVQLPPGASAWSSVSDRNAKENFAPLNPRAIAERVASLRLETWNYKSQAPSIRHIGPVAQDFRAAFGVGEDDRHISTVDADGVALAAIQGLYQIIKDKDAEIAVLRAEKDAAVTALRQQNDDLATRLTAVEALIAGLNQQKKGD
jgi:hypothetical protein